MRRAAVTVIVTIVGLVLMLQFKTHPATTSGALANLGSVTPTQTPGSSHHHRTSRSHPATSSTASPSKPPSHRGRTSSTPTPRTVTSTGQTVQTRYGPVQVKIVETSGRITQVTPLQLPSGNPRSTEIATSAAPILRTEALQANSARIHVVSGATYTSDGYAQSLQSAIDGA